MPADELRASPATSYDNTAALGAEPWRHVAFIEQQVEVDGVSAAPDSWVAEAQRQQLVDAGVEAKADDEGFRWLMSSDVCKHCTDAGCLDGLPHRLDLPHRVRHGRRPGGHLQRLRLLRPACPFGVLDRREDDGRVWKCTLCYDRLKDDMEPACAKACPTDSIQFGELEELRERARRRVEHAARARAIADARLYGDDPSDGVGGAGAFFLLLDEPEVVRPAARSGGPDPPPRRGLGGRGGSPPSHWGLAFSPRRSAVGDERGGAVSAGPGRLAAAHGARGEVASAQATRSGAVGARSAAVASS